MTILSDSGDGKVLGGENALKFDYTTRKDFAGLAFPEKLDNGIYYKPKAGNFAAIDSVGVDGSGSTLYFFQMKSKAVKPVKGTTVETYWNTAVASHPA